MALDFYFLHGKGTDTDDTMQEVTDVDLAHASVEDEDRSVQMWSEIVTCTNVEEVAAVLRECVRFREGVYRDQPLRQTTKQEKKSPPKDSEVTDMHSDEEPNETSIDDVQALKAEGVVPSHAILVTPAASRFRRHSFDGPSGHFHAHLVACSRRGLFCDKGTSHIYFKNDALYLDVMKKSFLRLNFYAPVTTLGTLRRLLCFAWPCRFSILSL